MTGCKASCLAHISAPFLPHSYGYEAANEPKSALKLLVFRFGSYSRTGH